MNYHQCTFSNKHTPFSNIHGALNRGCVLITIFYSKGVRLFEGSVRDWIITVIT